MWQYTGVPSTEVYSITGDKAGNVWLSGNRGLSHLRDGHLIEHFPWSALGRHQQAKVIVFDRERGGLWLSFWNDGGVEYFKDGQVRASYTAADGLGKGHVPGLRLDRDGAVWAATEDGGLSRIKDGHITTMTTRNGLPCNTIHWSIEDNDRSFWLYTGCGLVRIARAELDAWIADPTRRIETTVWDAADGVMLHSISPNSFGPPFAKSIDGKLWLLIGEGIQVVDPHHLAFNKLPPPVHIEQIVADHKMYWQNLPGAASVERASAGANSRSADRLHRSQPHRAGEGSFQVQTGGAGSRLERGDQRSPGAVFEPASGALPVSRDRVQQQRRVERAGRFAGVLDCSRLLPDELVSRPLRSSRSGARVGNLPDQGQAIAPRLRPDAGRARRRANKHRAGTP